jgi:4-hydroxymandelate oxidase
MFTGGPPVGADADPLRVTRAGRRAFAGMSDTVHDPELRVFLGDLVRPYGLPLRDDLLTEGAGHSYGEMAERLIVDTVSPDEPVDLLVLAFGIHDVRLGRSTAAYLSDVCPGRPMAFALCDQGTAATFSALRLIGEYGRSGACRRALLLVAEQSALHYRPPVAVRVPDRHVAVALLCERSTTGGPTVVRQHADVPPGLAGALLADEVAACSAGRADVTLVLGAGLDDVVHTRLADEVVHAPAGQPHTGPWWELAGGLADWRADGRLVLLAEYDPGLRYLSLAATDLTGATALPVAVAGNRVAT